MGKGFLNRSLNEGIVPPLPLSLLLGTLLLRPQNCEVALVQAAGLVQLERALDVGAEAIDKVSSSGADIGGILDPRLQQHRLNNTVGELRIDSGKGYAEVVGLCSGTSGRWHGAVHRVEYRERDGGRSREKDAYPLKELPPQIMT